jgi:hypothetical protein
MRVLAILTVVLTLSGQAQTPHNSGNISKTAQSEATSNTNPAQQPTLIPKEVPAQHPQDETDKSHQSDRQEASGIIVVNSAARRDWVDYLGLFISFVLVCITGTGVLAAWRGLPEVLRQAKAAEDAALAAKKSADSQINIERPWLLFEQLKVPRYTRIGFDQPAQLVGTFKCVVWNYGKTPARVLALKVRLILGDSSKLPPDPLEVFGVPSFAINPHIIPQDQNRPLEERVFPRGSFSDREDSDIAASKIFVWALGMVRYADVHGGSYETRICYRYDFSEEELILDGPSEYNQAT